MPFLKRHPRLAPTLDRRIRPVHLPGAEIWIQAASAGEAYLAVSIIQALTPARQATILLTTTTDQGMEILTRALDSTACSYSPHIRLHIDLFPLDSPEAMTTAVNQVNPAVMVLLETELWPAHLHAMKTNQTCVLILNGRLSGKSSRNYRVTRAFWRCFSPDRILAVSGPDAQKFSRVFANTPVGTMHNIKFDRMTFDKDDTAHDRSALAGILPRDLPLSLFASFRRQEERQIIEMVKALLKKVPNQVIALFPRHMHRIDPVLKRLNHNGITVCKGSQITSPLTGPAVILWDRFGDLHHAYPHAHVVFVGATLVPLGGQNFMEPAAWGVPTVIGPHWDDFAWLGTQIFQTGAVTRCQDWQHAVHTMCHYLLHPEGSKRTDRPEDLATRMDAVRYYIEARQGGSQTAAEAILTAWVGKTPDVS